MAVKTMKSPEQAAAEIKEMKRLRTWEEKQMRIAQTSRAHARLQLRRAR